MLIRLVVLSLGLLLRFGFLSVLKVCGFFFISPTLPVIFTCLFFIIIMKLLHRNIYICNVKTLKL